MFMQLVLVVPLEGVSLDLVYGQLAALNPQHPVDQVMLLLVSGCRVMTDDPPLRPLCPASKVLQGHQSA